MERAAAISKNPGPAGTQQSCLRSGWDLHQAYGSMFITVKMPLCQSVIGRRERYGTEQQDKRISGPFESW